VKGTLKKKKRNKEKKKKEILLTFENTFRVGQRNAISSFLYFFISFLK